MLYYSVCEKLKVSNKQKNNNHFISSNFSISYYFFIKIIKEITQLFKSTYSSIIFVTRNIMIFQSFSRGYKYNLHKSLLKIRYYFVFLFIYLFVWIDKKNIVKKSKNYFKPMIYSTKNVIDNIDGISVKEKPIEHALILTNILSYINQENFFLNTICKKIPLLYKYKCIPKAFANMIVNFMKKSFHIDYNENNKNLITSLVYSIIKSCNTNNIQINTTLQGGVLSVILKNNHETLIFVVDRGFITLMGNKKNLSKTFQDSLNIILGKYLKEWDNIDDKNFSNFLKIIKSDNLINKIDKFCNEKFLKNFFESFLFYSNDSLSQHKDLSKFIFGQDQYNYSSDQKLWETINSEIKNNDSTINILSLILNKNLDINMLRMPCHEI